MALFPVRTVWVLALNNQLSAPPAYDREHVYFPISGDRLVSYTLADGAQQWLFETIIQPLMFAAGLGHRLEDGFVASGWLLVGLIQILVLVAVVVAEVVHQLYLLPAV